MQKNENPVLASVHAAALVEGSKEEYSDRSFQHCSRKLPMNDIQSQDHDHHKCLCSGENRAQSDKTVASDTTANIPAILFCCPLSQNENEKDDSDIDTVSTYHSAATSALHQQRMGMPSHQGQGIREERLTCPQHNNLNDWKLIESSSRPRDGALAPSPSTSEAKTEPNYFWPYPTFYDFLDAILLFSCFRNVPVADGQRSQYSIAKRRQKVTIKVTKNAISKESFYAPLKPFSSLIFPG